MSIYWTNQLKWENIRTVFSYHMASFTLTPAALLNKSEWLASVLSHTDLCSSPSPPLSPSHADSQKKQTPMVDTAHVQGLIRIMVPWWRGTVRLARGACCHEACQRAFKEPRPRKRKQMAVGFTPPMDCTCFPGAPLPQILFNQCPENSLGLWSGRMSQCLGLSMQPLDHKVPADSCATLAHFHKQHHSHL